MSPVTPILTPIGTESGTLGAPAAVLERDTEPGHEGPCSRFGFPLGLSEADVLAETRDSGFER